MSNYSNVKAILNIFRIDTREFEVVIAPFLSTAGILSFVIFCCF